MDRHAPSKLVRSFSLKGWGPIDLPLRASYRKAKVKVKVEGQKTLSELTSAQPEPQP
jgi:hypothetical protein